MLNVIRNNPYEIEAINAEDISSIYFDDNEIRIKFNTSPEDVILLRSNDGHGLREWGGISLFITRIGMQIDMKK